MTILKSTGSWIEKILTYMCFHLSNEFYCSKSATKQHENMMQTRVNFTQNWLCDEQIVIGTRENKTLMVKKIIQRYLAHNKSPFNTSLSWREFSRFKGLVRPNRTGDIDFFRNRRQYFIIQVLILTQLFFNKSTWRWTIARTKCGHKFAFCQVWNVEIWAWAASVFTV